MGEKSKESKMSKMSNLLCQVNWRAGLLPDSGESGYGVEDVEGGKDVELAV